MMTTLSPRAQAVLEQFGQQPGVTPDQISNLQRVIRNSPPLVVQIEAAISEGHLRQFALLPPGSNAGGTYDGSTKTINLPASILSTQVANGRHDSAELAFVLGHEIQHGFNYSATSQAYQQFGLDARSAASSSHDYTDAIGTLIASNRRDEASAQIAGWNALVGLVKTEKPDADFSDIYNASRRAGDFVESIDDPQRPHVPRSNLSFEPDLTLRASSVNLEGMGQNYFDKSGEISRLGYHGRSDYPNYYGAYAVGVVSRLEAANAQPGAPPRMTINMDRLGLSEQLLEENGIHLGSGEPRPQPYWDSSTTPPTLHHFDHTHTTHTHIPIAVQEHMARQTESQERLNNAPQVQAETGTNSLTPMDQRLHGQIRAGVEALDARNGRSFDDTSERLTASLLVLAKERGLDRVDHVLLSNQTKDFPAAHNIFLVKGEIGDPAAQRAVMATSEAAVKPIDQSHAEIEAINQRQAAAPELSQAKEQELSQAAPSMSR